MMTLAVRIDQFMRGYDFYNYQDYLENDKQDHIDSINADLEAREIDHLVEYFRETVEDILADAEDAETMKYFRDDLNEASAILDRLEEIKAV